MPLLGDSVPIYACNREGSALMKVPMQTDVFSYPFDRGRQLTLDPRYVEIQKAPGLAMVRMPFGDPAWLVTRYDEVRAVLTDGRFVTRVPGLDPGAPRMYSDAPRVEVNLAHASGAEHTRLRKAMAKSFSARRVHGLRDRTTEIVTGLIDDMAEAGAASADFVAQFALPLPMYTICEILGVPVADAGQLMIWSNAFLGMKFAELSVQQVGEYVVAFTTYLDGLVAAQRTDPGECVLGELARACNDGVITAHEASMLAMGLMVTGREVSSIALANFVYLLDRLGQWRVLCADPGLVPSTVDELLRFTPLSVGAVLARKATEDAEVGGHLVRRGETVILSYDAANHDESIFTLPGELNPAREGRPHVAFGFGPHWCLGAELSRMMIQVALRELTSRLPDLRVTVSDEHLSWLRTMQFRGFAELPVAW